MKKILIINNEWSRDDKGVLSKGTVPEITHDVFIVTGLTNVVSSFEDVEVVQVFHSDLTHEMIEYLKPDRIITSGRMKDWDLDSVKTEYAVEIDLIKNPRIPLLGICGGQQLMAMGWDKPIGRMEKDGEEVSEFGAINISLDQEDLLFNNISSPMKCIMAHVDEIKELPPGFISIASTEKCRYAAIKLVGKPVWGTQFHPELYQDEFPAGRQILENFIYSDIEI